ncbi:MAG: SsrA-binding protein SmpB [Acidimicrobiia bacterium]|nr:SsrA-binding protein SmpB [Acidimicrobiia bacterium]MXZ05938.1 SsrA-binding protein SmpB [Acidimicrobiia bacterium]MYD05173.1 SsrA-binding protein SmpB [Acidimicrobiia bacterium]
MNRKKDSGSNIARNRRARFDYVFEEEYEAGIVLTGSEVKSIRAGQVHLRESYGQVRRGEIWLVGMHIAPYEMAREGGHHPTRERKLLLNAREIERINRRVSERGLTIVPISMYWKRGRVKVQIGIGRGSRRYDKREKIKARDMERETRKALSRRHRP